MYCRMTNNEVVERILKKKLLWKNIVKKWKWVDRPHTLSEKTVRTNIIERSVERKNPIKWGQKWNKFKN